MTKKPRNYNQDYFKVAGSLQPGDEEVPRIEKQEMTQQGRRARKGKIPPGAPGHWNDAG